MDSGGGFGQLNGFVGNSLIIPSEKDTVAKNSLGDLDSTVVHKSNSSSGSSREVRMDTSWDQNGQIERTSHPTITITVEPVSSDDECSEPDSSCIFFELSETETSDKTVAELDDSRIILACERKRSVSEAESGSHKDHGELTFECLGRGQSGSSFPPDHKSGLIRANSSPEDANLSVLDSGSETSLKLEEKPRRRNTIADIFRWSVLSLNFFLFLGLGNKSSQSSIVNIVRRLHDSRSK